MVVSSSLGIGPRALARESSATLLPSVSRPIKDPGYDNLTANILAREPLTDDIQVVENPDNWPVWSLDNRCLGEFKREEDADVHGGLRDGKTTS